MVNVYLKSPNAVRKLRSGEVTAQRAERLLFILVKRAAEGKGFEGILNSIERRMRRSASTEILETRPSQPQRVLTAKCRSELSRLSELYEVVEAQRVSNIKELRDTGALTRETYSDYMRDHDLIRRWFLRQEERLASEYSDQLPGYAIDPKYASYRIVKVMMWDVDDSLTPTNIPSMFDGLLQKIQEKCDEGFRLTIATGKPVRYVRALLEDPYATGVLIRKVMKVESGEPGKRKEGVEQIRRIISQGRAGMISDLDLLGDGSDLSGFREQLESRKEREWLPSDIQMACESGCHVRFPDGSEFATAIEQGKTTFIPFEQTSSGNGAMAALSEINSHLDNTFNSPGVLFIHMSPEGTTIRQIESMGELPGGTRERAQAVEGTLNAYFDILSNGGLLYGESVEPRPQSREHLSSLKEKAGGTEGAVVIFDSTYSIAKQDLEQNGNLERLKELVREGNVGVTSDLALIESHESTGQLGSLLEIFGQREVMVLPKPAESFYSENEIMFCPRPNTYVDGDSITVTEQFVVKALNAVATELISERGLELDCVSANHGLDITPKGVSKPVALDTMGHTMPDGHKLVIYAGDSGNDMSIMSLKGHAETERRTGSTLIPIAVLFKESSSGGERRVPTTVLEISDARLSNLDDIDCYQMLVQKKIEQLRAGHEPVRREH